MQMPTRLCEVHRGVLQMPTRLCEVHRGVLQIPTRACEVHRSVLQIPTRAGEVHTTVMQMPTRPCEVHRDEQKLQTRLCGVHSRGHRHRIHPNEGRGAAALNLQMDTQQPFFVPGPMGSTFVLSCFSLGAYGMDQRPGQDRQGAANKVRQTRIGIVEAASGQRSERPGARR